MSLSNKVNNNNNSKSYSRCIGIWDGWPLAREALVQSLPQMKSRAVKLYPADGEVSYPGYTDRQAERLLDR